MRRTASDFIEAWPFAKLSVLLAGTSAKPAIANRRSRPPRMSNSIICYFTRTFAGREITGADHRRVKMTSILLEINLFADEQRCTALLRRFNCASESRCARRPVRQCRDAL